MPKPWEEINGMNNIVSGFNGSNVDFGQLLQSKYLLDSYQKSKNIGNPKAIAEQATQQFKSQIASPIPTGAMTASQHSVTTESGQIRNAAKGEITAQSKGETISDKPKQSLGSKVTGALGGTGGLMSAASGAIDAVSGLIKNRPEYSGKYGKITKSMDAGYDAVKNIVGKVPGFGQVASLAMGAGKLLNKAVGRLGGGTDGMTKADAILGSNFLGLTPLGLINGFGGKKADTYTRNLELDKSTNGGFSGFLTTQTGTEAGAGKKFGLFSRSAMNKQNQLTEFTTNMKHTVSGVVDTNTLNNMAAQGSIPFLAQQQQVDLSGGIQQMRAARQGMQFSRRVVSKYQIGNKLKQTIQTIDIADGKFVEIPLNLTKEQIKGKEPIKLPGGKVVFMNGDGTVTSDRWETIGEREHITPKGQNGLVTPKLDSKQIEEESEKENLFQLIENSDANFAKRLKDPNRKAIKLPDGNWGNFKLSWSEDETGVIVYPEIQEINGKLIDLSGDRDAAWESAIKHNDYIYFPSREAAEWFTTHYKEYYKGFDKKPESFKQGGQMNVIPEGALHARLHHLDQIDPDLAKEITHKGIPVITVEENGKIVQHAEIEHSEIIFTLEVTNKIEDLRKKYHEDKKDEYAIEAGKILVTQILHNTDDRTNLIDSVE